MSDSELHNPLEAYQYSLEKVFSLAEKDYWVQIVDINRHQVIVGRNYLWVSVALLGTYIAGLREIKSYFDVIVSHHCILLFIVSSIVLAISAFGCCLYAMPAKGGYQKLHTEGWGELSKIAHEMCFNSDEYQKTNFMADLISKLDHAASYNLVTNIKRGKMLRAVFWMLFSSFALALIAFLLTSTILL